MRIGVPREIRALEGRVALLPEAVHELVEEGCSVHLETGAGTRSGYPDDAYRAAGATIEPDAEHLYGESELVVKVKEPRAGDLAHLRPDHLLFCFLHLAADPDLVRTLCRKGLTALAFETLSDGKGLPLLAPMSAVAGRVAVQAGAQLLHAQYGGRGILLGGIPRTDPGRVVVLGAGVAGSHAARAAHALGAHLTVLDIRTGPLRELDRALPRIETGEATPEGVAAAVADADLVIGAVLVPGARAPRVVTRGMVEGMAEGAVIVDIAVDQGGCVETTRPGDYQEPYYVESGVLHMAVTNLPGAVPRTASQALSRALVPWLLRFVRQGIDALPGAVNIRDGEVVHAAVREAMKESDERDTLG